MRDTFVIAPSGAGIQTLARVSGSGLYSHESPTSMVSGDGPQLVVIAEAQDVAQYYVEAPESAAIRVCGDDPAFFHVRFRDHHAAAALIIDLFKHLKSVIVDNDHGLLLSISQFDKLTSDRPNWDWSTAESEVP